MAKEKVNTTVAEKDAEIAAMFAADALGKTAIVAAVITASIAMLAGLYPHDPKVTGKHCYALRGDKSETAQQQESKFSRGLVVASGYKSADTLKVAGEVCGNQYNDFLKVMAACRKRLKAKLMTPPSRDELIAMRDAKNEKAEDTLADLCAKALEAVAALNTAAIGDTGDPKRALPGLEAIELLAAWQPRLGLTKAEIKARAKAVASNHDQKAWLEKARAEASK